MDGLAETSSASRFRILAIAFAFTSLLALALTEASPASTTATSAAKHRVGGKVRSAWPYKGRPPSDRLARWLAGQVGPTCPKAKKKHGAKASKAKRRKCLARLHRKGRNRSAAVSYSNAGVPQSRSSAVATTAASSFTPATLALTRSYEIPADDPSYTRLLNWSWTYDSAITAAAFGATGNKKQAAQLLDQLSALQFTDGSLDIAFEVSTGKGAGQARAGTSAWLGLAAATYDLNFKSNAYRETEKRAAKYLLSLQGADGLIRGGSDVTWVSTQHNLLAYTFLVRLANELGSAGATYRTAATAIASGIGSKLFVNDATGPHFIQGVGDTAEPIDVQAIGAMYLAGRGQMDLAKQVLARATTKFSLSGLGIVKSSNPATFNQTYAAVGPFSGFKAYAGDSIAPGVIWFDGAAMMIEATGAVGQDTKALLKATDLWQTVTAKIKGSPPLQASQVFVSPSNQIEYHVWPAASSAAWLLLAKKAPTFFAAPL